MTSHARKPGMCRALGASDAMTSAMKNPLIATIAPALRSSNQSGIMDILLACDHHIMPKTLAAAKDQPVWLSQAPSVLLS